MPSQDPGAGRKMTGKGDEPWSIQLENYALSSSDLMSPNDHLVSKAGTSIFLVKDPASTSAMLTPLSILTWDGALGGIGTFPLGVRWYLNIMRM